MQFTNCSLLNTGRRHFWSVLLQTEQWRNRLTGGPWTNYIKDPIPHFEFTKQFIIIKLLTKVTIKHVHKKISCRVE